MKTRDVHTMMGKQVLERIRNGHVWYSMQRPKVQAAIDGMVACELVQVVSDRVMIVAGGVKR